jgi:hypothetical protein
MARLTDRIPLVQSEPVPVQLCGFFSNTYLLGREGWKLALDENYMDPYATRAVLHHERLELTLFGQLRGGNLLRTTRMDRGYGGGPNSAHFGNNSNFERQERAWYAAVHEDTPHIELQRAGGRSTHVLQMPSLKEMSWRDTQPEFSEVATSSELYRLPLFAELHAARPDTQELIVEPADVQCLLDQILAAQGPMRREIRTRDKRRDADGSAAAAPRQVHAQIVSLHAA